MAEPFADIANRLELARSAFGLSAADFARGAGIGPNALYNHMSGRSRIGLGAALRLREAYGLPLDWIYCGGSVDKLPANVRSALSSSPRSNHSQ